MPPDTPLVLDADALALWSRFSTAAVLTPHEGEFARLFPDLSGARTEQASAAAARTHSVLVLKGPDTVIAGPDGRLVVNTHASPYLAKAGTGDVLAGLIAGLVAQGMPAFEAACAAVWMHGEAGKRIGPGLIAGDIVDALPGVLQALLTNSQLA